MQPSVRPGSMEVDFGEPWVDIIGVAGEAARSRYLVVALPFPSAKAYAVERRASRGLRPRRRFRAGSSRLPLQTMPNPGLLRVCGWRGGQKSSFFQ